MKDTSGYALPPTASIREALKKIDKMGFGLAFIADRKGKLVGIVTDGDIRRALLRGATLNATLQVAGNFNPIQVRNDASPQEINALFADPRIKTLPVVDGDGVLVDFIDRYRERSHLPVARPIFQGNELKYVSEALLSGWVSSAGPFVVEFEKAFAKFCGTRHAVSCSNGTTALHLALLALGVGPGDEVIVPSLTFIATANAVRYVGAKPVFVDIESTYWQIDASKIESAITKKTRAIIPVHLYGHPAKMDDVMRVARKHALSVVEDAAEAIGAKVKGKNVGTWGSIGVFSFFGNKIITTGEGGMLATDEPALAEKLLMLRDHGMSRTRRYVHEMLGYNYRMTNLQAALGVAQLERVDAILQRKIQVARWYAKYLRNIPAISLPAQASWAKNVYWMYSICIDEKKAGMSRDEFVRALEKRRIDTRPFFIPIHRQPIYGEYKNFTLPVTEAVARKGLNLPSSVELTESDVKHVATAIRDILS